MPVATVEAKRKNVDVSGALQQAKRYSRSFVMSDDMQPPGGPWGEYRIPFVFSSNGRPYLRQLATRSGIWFCDVRRGENLSHALDGWYTPEGLVALMKRDEERSHQQLAEEPLQYDFALRPYQQTAIRAIETGIAGGRREMLVAMATGTGKTKTCIALVYRLLKAQRFRRVLFLVDRSALGEQAANAFKDTRMENLQTFADIFGIKELEEQQADSETAVHIATVQGMVQRILYPGEDEVPPPVDQYDCIIVDECHRGYLLDRELSDAELPFRGFDDYISKYRRVLDYFDAVKIGLTATPALHTTQIFGAPIFTYSYREAVIDGFLVDYEPAVQIRTDLSEGGIAWKVGEQVAVYDTRHNQIDLFTTPDEIKINVEDFNRKVITEPFNRVICQFLAKELDPDSRQKTLIFCVNDAQPIWW
jgi:type I restriction enzyme R subunit